MSPAAESAPLSPLDHFTDDIRPTRVGLPYQLGLAVVALAMVLLPLIYAGFIGLVGWAVWWHAVHDLEIIQGRGGGLFKVIAYLGPIVVGGVMILFMLKPFFARPVGREAGFALGHDDEPELFRFLGRLCQLVGAPPPSRVDVDCQVNASAGFRGGLRSLFGNDIVLTIGLPLAAGLSAREFAGVLAHEFGHFAQGAGMRLSYVIRSVSFWFARVVYERDQWDVWLAETAQETDWRLAIVLHLARAGVWFSRRVLWCLMVAGNAISCFLLRQMEFDADSYEAKIAGSAAFADTTRRMRVLNLGTQSAYQSLRETWKQRRLVDDFPAFVLNQAHRVPPEIHAQMDEAAAKAKTGAFDTHPADPDRIRAAEALGEPGVFTLDAPATALFRDFAALSRAVTRHHSSLSSPSSACCLPPAAAGAALCGVAAGFTSFTAFVTFDALLLQIEKKKE